MGQETTGLGREPSRAEIDQLEGPVVLEFGASWCPICQAAAPEIAASLGRYPGFRHIKIEDGRGRRLGRSFGVKLWPTLVFLRDGRVLAQTVRPEGNDLRAPFEALANSAPVSQAQTDSP